MNAVGHNEDLENSLNSTANSSRTGSIALEKRNSIFQNLSPLKSKLTEGGMIDQARKETHVIYDITSMDLENTSLARNCHFKYSESKGVKTYEAKDGELKIERYFDEEEGEGQRIGRAMLDLSLLIEKGI